MNMIELLILIGRPGAGKSEIIDYLKKQDENERLRRFGIGPFTEIDDFPMLWAWFEEDAILEQMGLDRLHSDPDGYFLSNDLWHVLIRRLELEYNKFLVDQEDSSKRTTVIVEFSRGTQHGGFEQAFAEFSSSFLSNAVVLYIDVSWEESLRKNRKRFNPDRPHSILEHGMDDHKLSTLYQRSDWKKFSAGDPQYLLVGDVRVPYVEFPNQDDVTTPGGDPLGNRLEETLAKLRSIQR